MSEQRQPAECFHVGTYIDDECGARGWTMDKLAHRMGGDIEINRACLDFLQLRQPGLLLGEYVANGLARAFGSDAQTWLNLDKAWQDWHTARRGAALRAGGEA